MQYRPLGQSGIEASVVGLGAWAIGGWAWGGTDEAEAIDAIKTSIDNRINLIDTAPVYGLGRSEEIIGKAVEGRRDKVIIATKCGLVWHTDKGQLFFEQGGKPIHRYLGAESIRYEVEQSLKRLNTDYIDLLQTHWQDPTTPIEETMKTLLELKKEGKILAIGVSNVSVDQLEQYQKVGPVDSDQENYSMLDREIEEKLLPYDLRHGIAVLAYSPLALGLLTGKVGPEREFPEGDMRRTQRRFSTENRKNVMKMLEEFTPVAESHGITPAQAVIQWTIQQPGITHALVGARNAQQARENARAGDAILTQDEVYALNEIRRQYEII